MRWMRSTWPRRWAVFVMTAGLLSLLATPPTSVTQTSDAHADWLRAHVAPLASEDVAQAVDAALDAASAHPAASLDDYVGAFVDAYEAEVDAGRVDVSVSSLFALGRQLAGDVDGHVIVRLLQQRAHQVGRSALLPRLAWTATGPPVQSTASGRSLTASVSATTSWSVSLVHTGVAIERTAAPFRLLLRTLTPARPMGP